jgi:thioredoxin-like negative regulator of GroEL
MVRSRTSPVTILCFFVWNALALPEFSMRFAAGGIGSNVVRRSEGSVDLWGVIVSQIRGGDGDTASGDTDTAILSVGEGPSLDEKVHAAMRKLGLSPPERSVGEEDSVEYKDGTCPMPEAPLASEQQQSASKARPGKEKIDPYKLADTIAKEYNVDVVLAFACVGATQTQDGDEPEYHPQAARNMIRHELNLIDKIPEDSPDVLMLMSEGYDKFMSRRALAFADGAVDNARAILAADQLDAEEAAAEEEQQLEAAETENEDEADALAQLRAESATNPFVEVNSNFDPTGADGASNLSKQPPPTQQQKSPSPEGMPTPAAKNRVVFEATTEQIQELVLESDVPVLLDVYADWCGPCKALTPALEDMAVKAGGIFRLVKLNSDNERPASSALEITSLPTVFGIRDGRIVNTFQGMPRSEDFMRKFMMGLFGAAPFSPPLTADEEAKYEELSSKLIKTAGAACFSFSAREKLNDRITTYLDEIVLDDSIANVEDSATLLRTLCNNIIRNPYDQKYRKVNLENKLVAAKIGQHPKCLAILKSVGFAQGASVEGAKEMVLHKDKKVINIAPLVVARDCIGKWVQSNRKAMAAAARKRQDELDRARLKAEAEAVGEVDEDEEVVGDDEGIDPTACTLKIRLDGRKKIHEFVMHQDDPLGVVLDALSIDPSVNNEEVQITCVAKRLVVKSSERNAMKKTLAEYGLLPSASLVVSTITSKAATTEPSGSSLKDRATAKKKKSGSHTMQSIGIYAKDDKNKAELIDGGGGTLFEHDVSDDDEAGEEASSSSDVNANTETPTTDQEEAFLEAEDDLQNGEQG